VEWVATLVTGNFKGNALANVPLTASSASATGIKLDYTVANGNTFDFAGLATNDSSYGSEEVYDI
jgi:hypothetical protein